MIKAEITLVMVTKSQTPLADCAENKEKLTPRLNVKYRLKHGKTGTETWGARSFIAQNFVAKSDKKTINETR